MLKRRQQPKWRGRMPVGQLIYGESWQICATVGLNTNTLTDSQPSAPTTTGIERFDKRKDLKKMNGMEEEVKYQ